MSVAPAVQTRAGTVTPACQARPRVRVRRPPTRSREPSHLIGTLSTARTAAGQLPEPQLAGGLDASTFSAGEEAQMDRMERELSELLRSPDGPLRTIDTGALVKRRR